MMPSSLTDPLLLQLQQSFLSLTQNTQDTKAITLVLTKLYEQQQMGNGVVLIHEIESEFELNIKELQRNFPSLFNEKNSTSPIVIFEPFMAFRRTYWQLQETTQMLLQRSKFSPPSINSCKQIQWQFSHGHELSTEQKIAVFSAASLPFCVITGGAGTGKTTTLTKALELILLDIPDADILLAAPTGKAAQRLKESINKQLDSVNISVRGQIEKLQPLTLHRLLAISEESGRPFRNKNNPLSCQILAIDEASMVSSDLLKQTLDALPSNTKLILLGDANQLPPINSPAFFNEISRKKPLYTFEFSEKIKELLLINLPDSEITHHAPLANQVCWLSTSRRFKQQSIIEQCANASLNQDASAFIQALGPYLYPIQKAKALYQQIADSYPVDQVSLLESLAQRIILCANRQGEFGSTKINHYLDTIFRTRIGHPAKEATWYTGRRILIEKNYPNLHLNNGDIGHCFEKNGEWYIDFGNKRQINTQQLPENYSLAFAITIHKSQGSEYQHVDIILDNFDPDKINTLITAPLIYTGITRAKNSLNLYSNIELINKTLDKRIQEDSPSSLLMLFESHFNSSNHQ